MDPAIAAAFVAAKSAWPTITLTADVFLPFLAERIPDKLAPVEGLASLAVSDLYLACACLEGDREAYAQLEKRFFGPVSAHLARRGAYAAQIDEVLQLLRERLFLRVGEARPKLALYGGKSALGPWIQMTGLRIFLNLVRVGKSNEASIENFSLASPNADPELRYMKVRYQDDFRAAFAATLASISPEQRTVLRLYFMDGMTVQEIGVLYRVHASTISRWIARARGDVLSETRRLLCERLRLGESELASVMGLLESQLDLSIGRLLQTGQGTA
jgi:RNA polymerase sigma-70 factor, ECF subfamily